MRRLLGVLFTLVTTTAFVAVASAESTPPSPTLPMTFKTSLAPGSRYFFNFRLFDTATGGTELWTETTPRKLTVSPTRTIQWNLGSVVPFSEGLTGPVSFSQQPWVQFTGGGKTPARVKLNVVPWSDWLSEFLSRNMEFRRSYEELVTVPVPSRAKVLKKIVRKYRVVPVVLSAGIRHIGLQIPLHAPTLVAATRLVGRSDRGTMKGLDCLQRIAAASRDSSEFGRLQYTFSDASPEEIISTVLGLPGKKNYEDIGPRLLLAVDLSYPKAHDLWIVPQRSRRVDS